MWRLWTLAFLLPFTDGSSQSVSTLLGARAAGMGYASATLQDEWSIFNNISGIAELKETQASAAYEVRPSLTAANRLGALAIIPIAPGTLGISVFRFGDDIYSEQIASVGFANRIGNTSLGGRISYIQYRADGFGTKSTVGIDLGGITKLADQLFIGAWIQNVNRPKLKFNNEEKAPIKLFASLAFKPSEKFFVCTELEKDVLYPVIWKTGMEYSILKKFFARIGVNVNPNAMFAGVGFKSWRIKIDYALQGFTQFSSTHQASATYSFTGNKKPEK